MDFEVVQVEGQPRPWSSRQGGSFLSYTVVLQDEAGQSQKVEWSKKAEAPAPRVGDWVAGHVEQGPYSLKFKVDYDRTKELAFHRKAEAYQPSSIPQGPPIQAGPTTPAGQSAKDAAIARMAAQKVAMGYYQALAAAGKLPQDFSPHQVSQAADFFEQDARR